MKTLLQADYELHEWTSAMKIKGHSFIRVAYWTFIRLRQGILA